MPRRAWGSHLLGASSFFLFFFQAEDGIRDDLVTGVQTCALPICHPGSRLSPLPQLTGDVGRSCGDASCALLFVFDIIDELPSTSFSVAASLFKLIDRKSVV